MLPVYWHSSRSVYSPTCGSALNLSHSLIRFWFGNYLLDWLRWSVLHSICVCLCLEFNGKPKLRMIDWTESIREVQCVKLVDWHKWQDDQLKEKSFFFLTFCIIWNEPPNGRLWKCAEELRKILYIIELYPTFQCASFRLRWNDTKPIHTFHFSTHLFISAENDVTRVSEMGICGSPPQTHTHSRIQFDSPHCAVYSWNTYAIGSNFIRPASVIY